MNNKALITPTLNTMLAIIVAIIWIIIWFFLLNAKNPMGLYRSKAAIFSLHDDDQVLALLRTPLPPGTLADELILSVAKKQPQAIEETLEPLLTELFGKPVCWKVSIDERPFSNQPCASFENKKMLDAESVLPFNKRAVTIRLEVTGFRR